MIQNTKSEIFVDIGDVPLHFHNASAGRDCGTGARLAPRDLDQARLELGTQRQQPCLQAFPLGAEFHPARADGGLEAFLPVAGSPGGFVRFVIEEFLQPCDLALDPLDRSAQRHLALIAPHLPAHSQAAGFELFRHTLRKTILHHHHQGRIAVLQPDTDCPRGAIRPGGGRIVHRPEAPDQSSSQTLGGRPADGFRPVADFTNARSAFARPRRPARKRSSRSSLPGSAVFNSLSAPEAASRELVTKMTISMHAINNAIATVRSRAATVSGSSGS